jgi:hypothetical protein
VIDRELKNIDHGDDYIKTDEEAYGKADVGRPRELAVLGTSSSVGSHDLAIGSCRRFYMEPDSLMGEEDYDPLQGFYDEEQLKREQERYAQIEQETFDRDIEALMSTEHGRRFAWRLLGMSGVFLSTFNPKATDPGMNMAFEEGKKQAGYWLLGEIQRLCPQQYFVMTEEQKKWQMNKLRLARQA